LVFEKSANFFAENLEKSQKIVIITLVFEKSANFFAENCDHNIGHAFFRHTGSSAVAVFAVEAHRRPRRIVLVADVDHQVAVALVAGVVVLKKWRENLNFEQKMARKLEF
jgi:hypothetical protein